MSKENIYFENYERFNELCFISDNLGHWELATEKQFQAIHKDFNKGKVNAHQPLIASDKTENEEIKYSLLDNDSFCGPSLHILVVTLTCNHACVYCRVSPVSEKEKKTFMNLETAKKSIDMVFRSPNQNITIEFQGGEALLNWDVVKETILYAKKRNNKFKKDLKIAIVTNLSLMDEEKFNFLVKENVAVCTSLDGPEDLHNKNRRFGKTGAYSKVTYWLNRFKEAGSNNGKKDSLPSALMTTTKYSLPFAKEIVDLYQYLGLGGVFIRFLSPIGHAGQVWNEIGYTPAEFKKFYSAALDRVLEINKNGGKFIERNAALFAAKLFKNKDPFYLDLKSPCGAATGQLAYNWNGDIYTCDEGRMIGAGDDDFFKVGNVFESKWNDLFSSDAAKFCAMASCLESQPFCSRCAFKSYCGICPVHNYSSQNNPWGNINGGYWCGIQKAIFTTVLTAISKGENAKIIRSWLE